MPFTLFRGGAILSISLLCASLCLPDDGQVQIKPRAKPATENSPPLPAPNLRVNVPLVLVPVQVTTPLGRAVTGLERGDFRMFEDSAERPITAFSTDDAPVSVGVLFDSSGS